MSEFFWTYKYDGELMDYEHISKADALNQAHDDLAIECAETLVPSHNEVFNRDIHLVYYTFRDGDIIIDECESTAIEYTHEASDREQHFYQGDYI